MSKNTFKIEDVDTLGSTDTLSSEEKEKIFQEMDELFSNSDDSATESTQFDISNASKGIFFPIVFNVVLIAGVVTALVFAISFINTRDQESIASELLVESSASDLAQEIISQNKVALERQSQELLSIQAELEGLLSGKQDLDQIYADRLTSFKRQLDDALQDEQLELRRTLEAQQISEEEIEERLREQEVRIRAEYESQIAEYETQLNQEKSQREEDLQAQIEQLEREENAKRANLQALEQEIAQREDDLERELEVQRVALESQRSEAESRLFALQQANENKKKTFVEFDLFHKNIIVLIEREEYQEADIAIQNALSIINDSGYANEFEAQVYIDAFVAYEAMIDAVSDGNAQDDNDGEEIDVVLQNPEVVTELENTVSEYEQQVSDLEERIAELQSNNRQMTQQVSGLQTRETSLERERTQLNAQLQKLQNDYNEFRAQSDLNAPVGNAGMTARETRRILDNINTIVNYFVTVKSSGRDDPNMKEEITRFINDYEIYGDIISTLSLVLDPSGDIVF